MSYPTLITGPNQDVRLPLIVTVWDPITSLDALIEALVALRAEQGDMAVECGNANSVDLRLWHSPEGDHTLEFSGI